MPERCPQQVITAQAQLLSAYIRTNTDNNKGLRKQIDDISNPDITHPDDKTTIFNTPLPPEGRTLLHIAVEKENTGAVELLLKNNSPVETVDSNNQTPIHTAAQLGNLEIYKLLRPRTSILREDSNQKAPLEHATANQRIPIIKYELEQQLKTYNRENQATNQRLFRNIIENIQQRRNIESNVELLYLLVTKKFNIVEAGGETLTTVLEAENIDPAVKNRAIAAILAQIAVHGDDPEERTAERLDQYLNDNLPPQKRRYIQRLPSYLYLRENLENSTTNEVIALLNSFFYRELSTIDDQGNELWQPPYSELISWETLMSLLFMGIEASTIIKDLEELGEIEEKSSAIRTILNGTSQRQEEVVTTITQERVDEVIQCKTILGFYDSEEKAEEKDKLVDRNPGRHILRDNPFSIIVPSRLQEVQDGIERRAETIRRQTGPIAARLRSRGGSPVFDQQLPLNIAHKRLRQEREEEPDEAPAARRIRLQHEQLEQDIQRQRQLRRHQEQQQQQLQAAEQEEEQDRQNRAALLAILQQQNNELGTPYNER